MWAWLNTRTARVQGAAQHQDRKGWGSPAWGQEGMVAAQHGDRKRWAVTTFYFSSSAASMSYVTVAYAKEMFDPSKIVSVVKRVLSLRGLCVFLRERKDRCPNVGVSTLYLWLFTSALSANMCNMLTFTATINLTPSNTAH